jgi:hypothetical protein
VDVCRNTNLSPVFCIDCTCGLALAGELYRVTPQQQICRQTIAGRQTKDDLSYLDRIESQGPSRTSALRPRALGRFTIGKQVRHAFIRTRPAVRPHSARLECVHLDPQKGPLPLTRDSVNPPTAHLAAWMVASAAGTGQAAAYGAPSSATSRGTVRT